MKSLILIIFLFISFNGCSFQNTPSSNIEITQKNKIQIKDFLDLTQYKGKKLILHFWTPSCFVCKPEIEELASLSKVLSRNNFEIITIVTLDTSENTLEYIHTHPLPFFTIIDANQKIAEEYNISLLPVTIILDETGNPLNIKDSLNNLTNRIEGSVEWKSEGVLKQLINNRN